MKNKNKATIVPVILMFIAATISTITLIRNLLCDYYIGLLPLSTACLFACAIVWLRRYRKAQEKSKESS